MLRRSSTTLSLKVIIILNCFTGESSTPGWMQSLYHHRGGNKEFNCIPLRLYEENLKALLQDATNHKLVPVDGFFFGEQEIYPEDLESVKEFVAKALAEIYAGRAVYYDSWW